MKTKMYISLIALIALTCLAAEEAHTWHFIQDGILQAVDSHGGTSFKRGGRLEADFIRLKGTNQVILLSRASATQYCVDVTNLAPEDLAYLAQAKCTPEEAAELQRQARSQADQARAKSEAALQQAKAVEIRKAQERQAQDKAQEAYAAKLQADRLVFYEPLKHARPLSTSIDSLYYDRAREAIQRLTDSKDPAYAEYAREILTLANGITDDYINGLKDSAQAKADEIQTRLDRLLTSGALP